MNTDNMSIIRLTINYGPSIKYQQTIHPRSNELIFDRVAYQQLTEFNIDFTSFNHLSEIGKSSLRCDRFHQTFYDELTSTQSKQLDQWLHCYWTPATAQQKPNPQRQMLKNGLQNNQPGRSINPSIPCYLAALSALCRKPLLTNMRR